MKLILLSFYLIFLFQFNTFSNEIDDCKKLASYPVNNNFKYGVININSEEQALEIIEVCNKLISNNPENGEYYLNLSRAYDFLDDHQKEIELLYLAIENNFFDHVYSNLSYVYLYGYHDEINQIPDEEKSIEILYEGDRNGDHVSQYLLGFYYLWGDFENILGPADVEKALNYFEKSKNDNVFSFLEYTLNAMPSDQQIEMLKARALLYNENKELHHKPLGWIYYHLSTIYSKNYKYVEQINSAKKTIEFISSANGEDYIGLSSDYHLLAEAYMRQGILGEADNFLNKAFYILNSNDYTNFEYEYFELVYTFAELAIAEQQDKKALDAFNEISNYFENNDRGFPYLEGQTYFYLADYYLTQKDFISAETFINKAEKVLEPYQSLSFYYDGFTEIKIDQLFLSGKNDELNDFLNSYKKYFESTNSRENINTTSLLNYNYLISKYDYLKNNPKKCIKEITNNLNILEQNNIKQTTFEFDNLIVLGNCYRSLNNKFDAYNTFIQAIKLKNNSHTIRDRFYPKHNIENVFEFVFQYSIDNKIYSDDLFEIIQISNLEETSSAIDEMFIRENINDAVLKEKLNNKKILQSSLEKINSEIIKLRTLDSEDTSNQEEFFQRKIDIQKEINLIDFDLNKNYPDLINYVNTKYLKLNVLQDEIQKDEAIIKFIGINDKIYLAFIDNNNFKLDLIDRKKQEFIREIKKYRSSLENPKSLTTSFLKGNDIYKDLFKTILNKIENKENLYVIMSPIINNLPLETLVKVQPQKNTNFSEIDWLINYYNFKYLPTFKSFNSLKLLQNDKKTGLEFLGVGDPVIASLKKDTFNFKSFSLRGLNEETLSFLKELDELPNTSNEIIRIGENFERKKILLRENASESNIIYKDNSAKFIVFATHALMPNELGNKSLPGLVLTIPDTVNENIDGLLTTSEIINTNFTSELIILSACNTAAGDIENVNSLSGLTKSFFFSGAKNIIASHWSVETYSAEKTTINLFKKSDESYSRRLRKSKLDLIKEDETGHPFFWAPFIFIGTN